MPAFHCQEKYGYVWVALGDPLKPIPDFPEDGQPGYRRIFQLYQEWKTSPVRMMENSFDNAHFSFVHGGTFGDPASPVPKTYEPDRNRLRVRGRIERADPEPARGAPRHRQQRADCHASPA